MDTQLKVFSELFLELLEIVSVFGDISEHFQNLFDDVFLNNLQDFVVLQELSGDVQWQVFGVDDSLDERQPFRD